MRYFLLKITVFFCLILFSLVLSQPAPADGGQSKISSRDQILFSLFKMKNTEPNYAAVIEGSAAYKSATSQYWKNRIFKEQSNVLKTAFTNFDLTKNSIDLKFDVFVRIINDFDIPVLQIRYGEQSSDKVPVFNYSYASDTVALRFEDLEDLIYIPLNESKYKKIAQFIKPDILQKMKVSMKLSPKHYEEMTLDDGRMVWVVGASVKKLNLYSAQNNGSFIETLFLAKPDLDKSPPEKKIGSDIASPAEVVK